MPSPKVDWHKVGHDRLDAARRLYEAGAPLHAIAAATGLTEPSIKRSAHREGWTAPEALRHVYEKATETAVAVQAKQNREDTALLISDEEAERLVESLGSQDVTIPERAAQYSAIMARVSMRIAVMHLKMTNQELLDNATKLSQLDSIARRTLNIEAPTASGGSGSGRTVVNVLSSATAGLPPALSGEAGVQLEKERIVFSTPGALPPVIEAEVFSDEEEK